jgi:hypothetical protein
VRRRLELATLFDERRTTYRVPAGGTQMYEAPLLIVAKALGPFRNFSLILYAPNHALPSPRLRAQHPEPSRWRYPECSAL